MARIVQLGPLTPQTIEGYIAHSTPITEGTATYTGNTGRIARIDWIDVTVERTNGNTGTESIARIFTTLSTPWVGSPTAGLTIPAGELVIGGS